MLRHGKYALGVIALLAGASAGAGQEPSAGAAAEPATASTRTSAASKSGHHLFLPTPRALLREMSTDRPDLTESPYTVDAGHAQIEVEAVTRTYDESEERTGYMGFLVKAGLTPRTDLQLGFESLHEDYRLDTGDGAPDVEGDTGVSNLTARLKWNLWGNDGGSTALAVMPYYEFPTHDQETVYGLILPLAIQGPWGTGLGTMAQVDLVLDADEQGRHAEWLFTATVARDLYGSLGAFVEGTSGHRPRSEGTWTGLVNTGLTFGATPDLQLDVGARLGVSDAAEGTALFLGISYRR